MSRLHLAPLASGSTVHGARPHALAWVLALSGCSLVTAVPDDSTQPSGTGAAPTNGGGGTGGDGGAGASGGGGGMPAVTTTTTGGGGASCQPGEVLTVLAETQNDSVKSIYDIELTHDEGLVLWGAHEAGETLFGEVVPGAGFFVSRVTSDLVPATNPPPTTNVPFTVFDVEPYFIDGEEGVWIGGNIVDTLSVLCLSESVDVADDPGVVAQYSLGVTGFSCKGMTTISADPVAENTYPLRGIELRDGGATVDVLTQLPFAASGVVLARSGNEILLPGASRMVVTTLAAEPTHTLVTDDNVTVKLPGGDRGPARTTVPYPANDPSTMFFSTVDIGDGTRRIHASGSGPDAPGLAVALPAGLFLSSAALSPDGDVLAYGAESEPATVGRVVAFSVTDPAFDFDVALSGGPSVGVRVADVSFAPDGSLYVLGRADGSFRVDTLEGLITGSKEVDVSGSSAIFVLQMSTSGEVLAEHVFDATSAEALGLEVTANRIYVAARLDDGGLVSLGPTMIDGGGSFVAALCR